MVPNTPSVGLARVEGRRRDVGGWEVGSSGYEKDGPVSAITPFTHSWYFGCGYIGGGPGDRGADGTHGPYRR